MNSTELFNNIVREYADKYNINMSAYAGDEFYVGIDLFSHKNITDNEIGHRVMFPAQKLHRCINEMELDQFEIIIRDYLDYNLNIYENNKPAWRLGLSIDVISDTIRIGEP